MRTKLRSKVTLLFLTLAVLIAVPAVAAIADTIAADADFVQPLNQAGSSGNPSEMGPVKQGGSVSKEVSFQLVCAGGNFHTDQGQTVTLETDPTMSGVPSGGSVTATQATIGPIPSTWPDDGGGCGTPPTPIEDNGNTTVTFNAPPSTGTATSYTFSVTWNSSSVSLAPSTPDDGQSVTGSTTVWFRATVDNTAPTVTAVSPTGNSELITTNVTATFSEAMDEASVEAPGNFTLTKPDGPDAGSDPDPVTATSVVYDSNSKTVTFDPDGNLDYSTTYTATVKGGATGVKDVAGNALAADKTWTFTTEPPPNSAPVANDQSVSTSEDTATTITLSGSDADGNNLTFEITDQPDNGQLGPLVPVNPSTANVTYTPHLNYNGPDSFKYRVNDGTANSLEATVSITVSPVNDAPSFTEGGNETVNEDSGARSVAWATGISAGPADEAGQTVSFQVTNDNNALFSDQPAISSSGTLTYTLAPNAFGTANVTVFAQDNGGTANGGDDTSDTKTFTITVTPVNDVPSFTKGADQTVNEDSGAHSVPNWATAISADPNESGQVLDFQVTTNTTRCSPLRVSRQSTLLAANSPTRSPLTPTARQRLP